MSIILEHLFVMFSVYYFKFKFEFKINPKAKKLNS